MIVSNSIFQLFLENLNIKHSKKFNCHKTINNIEKNIQYTIKNKCKKFLMIHSTQLKIKVFEIINLLKSNLSWQISC
jgi:pentose-5-phosphate-3-epimerase